MSRQDGQKTKILALLDLLEKQTDDQHHLTVPDMVELLNSRYDIPAERKSIYNDLDALIHYGYNIEQQRGRNGGYWLANRKFELPELKLLVDAVQSSRFITEKKSRILIEKLETLASTHQAKDLHRQVFVSGRVKSDNEANLYAVDTLHQAIADDKKVTFRYFHWNVDGKKDYHRTTDYQVSPWALAWENDNYYLIAYQDYTQPAGIRHYRVDRMHHVTMLEQKRSGKPVYDGLDLTAYIQRHFNMYGSDNIQMVTLRCSNDIASTIIDRFGLTAIRVPQEDGKHFHINVKVAISPQFFGWVCGLSPHVTIHGPESVREEMRAHLRQMAQDYF